MLSCNPVLVLSVWTYQPKNALPLFYNSIVLYVSVFSCKQNGNFYTLDKAMMDRNTLGPKHALLKYVKICFFLRLVIGSKCVPDLN